jgi:hypothetical protein
LDVSFVAGAIDYYVHAAPDPAPRRNDDIECARELQAAGIRAALHRHHYSSTAERTALARRETGFDLFGAIELNAAVGGLNPDAVDVALHAGAVFVSLPTNSASNMQVPGTWAFEVEQRLGLRRNHAAVPVLDHDGKLLDATCEVMRLVGDAGAVLGLGYLGVEECLAVVDRAAVFGIDRIVLTNPTAISGMRVDDVLAITANPAVFVEVVAFTLHPESLGGAANTDRLLALAGGATHTAAAAVATDPEIPARLASMMREVGVERCVLSSDGGHAGDVSPPEELAWACRTLADAGFTEAELQRLTRDAPAYLLGL